MRRARAIELGLLVLVLVAQTILFARPIHSATTYDEDVYLAAVDALRHGQALGSQVFAAQFPGFYDLLRSLSYVSGIGVVSMRYALLAVTLAGTVGAFLVGRRFGGRAGGLLAAAFLTIAPPLDLFGYQVIADTPELALAALALGLASFAGPIAAVAAGVAFGAALSVKLTALTAAPAAIWLLRRRLLPTIAGFAATIAIVLLAHLKALGDLWTSGVTYHLNARSTPPVMPNAHAQIFRQIPHSTPFFVLAAIAVVVFLAFLARRQPLPSWPLWTWVVLTLAFLWVHKPLHDNHLIEFPFTLALASAATLGAALDRTGRAAAPVAAVLALAAAAGWVQQLHRVDIARAPEPASNIDASRALARLTPPGSLVVDDRPIISFLADRRVVGPLVDLAVLRWEARSLTDAEAIRDLAPARAVVVSRALRDRPRILQYVHAHFRERYDRGGVRIYVR